MLVAAVVLLASLPAGAQQDPVADAQARADRVAGAYLDALTRSRQLEAEIGQLEQGIAQLEQQVTELRDTARGRAVEAYKRSGTPFDAQFGDGVDAMESVRRTVLLDLVNARDNDAANELRHARDALAAHRDELKTAQQQHADIVIQLKAEEQRLNAELVAAQDERRRASGAAGSGLSPSASYTPNPGEHPQHNHPFLVCTRGIESGGNYRAYNSSGPYYGAYQFDQSTWNATANRAGRGDLVGMDPRNASEYDQDDMAWTLFQWRGKQPWNGRC